MLIEIWSDVVCPWCYIGKRRLEEALAGFEHRDRVDVEWRSFQLDPSAPAGADGPTERVAEMIGRKYGGGADAGQQMIAQVAGVAAEVGLDFGRHAEGLHLNTRDAHRLLHAAGPLRAELKEAFLHAYFVEARNLADPAVLTEIATGVGVDADDVRAVLSSDRYDDEVEADVREAAGLGATGVPFFVVDRRYGVSGAQPVEVFTQLLERAWTHHAPSSIVTIGAGDGPGDTADAAVAPGCDDGACAVPSTP
ncbi:DsbA family oxidoreductase [Nocardioides sp. 1609]|uniref:DsbA family oxidoreductase n=1 Tax=Nocardioides sp. 1609 TaxID=2508327 RepID=UPI00106F230B|nr:DsbA family oxidoreductase [Nocardioides sp. 1609]